MITPVKYHRTYHLPWSESMTSDDKVVSDDTHFIGKTAVVTEKMDGENTSLYHDKIHARSISSRHHYTQDWVKSFWAGIRFSINPNMIIRGENLFAAHSIRYDNLPSYFLAFSVEKDGTVLDWNTAVEILNNIGICHVPVLYYGEYDKEKIHNTVMDKFDSDGGLDKHEGYVIRNAGEYNVSDAKFNINKWVRKNYVQTDKHWKHGKIEQNGLVV